MSASEPMSVADCLGSPWAIEWNGKTYQVGRPVPAAVEAIENEIARDAFGEAMALADIDPGMIKECRTALLARHHRVNGPLWESKFKTPEVQLLQLWAFVRLNHPEFTRDNAAAMYQDVPDQVELALLMAAPEFFDAVAAKGRLPHERAAPIRARQVERQQQALAARSPTGSAPTPP